MAAINFYQANGVWTIGNDVVPAGLCTMNIRPSDSLITITTIHTFVFRGSNAILAQGYYNDFVDATSTPYTSLNAFKAAVGSFFVNASNAGGTSGQLQFNDESILNGIINYEYDKANGVLREFLPKLYRRVNVTTNAPFFTGTATSGTTTQLNDTTKTFSGIAGKALLFTGGANQNQSRAIQSFTSTSITVTEAFPFAITAADAYEVIDVTAITTSQLNSVYAFFVTNNHAILLPTVDAINNGATNFYYIETLTTGKTVQFICATGQTIDGVSNNPNLAASREGVLQVAHNTAQPHWDTLAQVGLTAFATSYLTTTFSVTTTQTTFKPLTNVLLSSFLRFIAPTGNTNRIQYTSTIPRTLTAICTLNAKSDSGASQILTAKLVKFTKSTGLTTDITTATASITLTGAGDIACLTLVSDVSFVLGDQLWLEVKNDDTQRNYSILKMTTTVR